MPIPHKQRTRSDSIRLATPLDAEAIHNLDLAVFGSIDGGYPEFFFGHMIMIFPNTFWVLNDLSAYSLVILGEYSPWLYTLAVHPDKQSKGIGQRLLSFTEYELRKRHFLTLCLTVDASNIRAIQFYHNLHYRIIGKRINSEPERLVMRKAL